MTTTQELLGVIAALRQRLEQAQNLASSAGTVAATVLNQGSGDKLEGLRKKIAIGDRNQHLLQHSLQYPRRREDEASSLELPRHLTRTAARLLKQTRGLVSRLKQYTGEQLLQQEDHPAAVHYQDTVLLADLVLRLIQTLPENPGQQLRLCSGMDVLLGMIQQRTACLAGMVRKHRREEQHLQDLAGLLHRLHQGTLSDANSFFTLAEVLVEEAGEGQPLTFPNSSSGEPLQVIAGHCLTTARIVVRIARDDPHWRSSLLQPVVAALVHDVGMLTVPVELLAQSGPLNETQRGAMERHCQAGANLLAEVGKPHPWLIEAVRNHHERMDGTGYPAGLTNLQIDPLVRLLAVCDVYAALGSPRPHRPALDTRAVLKETQMLAQKGLLDRDSAELLLRLTAYPAGTAVELNDGACGVVIAGDQNGLDESRPSRPVVALLTDRKAKPLPVPRLLDLSWCEGRHVQRSLTATERSKIFGTAYPQYA